MLHFPAQSVETTQRIALAEFVPTGCHPLADFHDDCVEFDAQRVGPRTRLQHSEHEVSRWNGSHRAYVGIWGRSGLPSSVFLVRSATLGTPHLGRTKQQKYEADVQGYRSLLLGGGVALVSDCVLRIDGLPAKHRPELAC